MMILWLALVSLGLAWVRMAELSVGSTMERPVVSVSPVMKVNVSSMSLPLMISELSRTMVAMPGDCGGGLRGCCCCFFDETNFTWWEVVAFLPPLAAALPPRTRSSLAQASSSALRVLLEFSPCMAAEGGCTPISA